MAPAPLPQRGPTALTSFPTPSNATPTFNTPPPTLISRTQKWIEENQRLLILGAAVAVVGGAGYLLYNRPPPRSGGRGGEAGSAEGGAKKKKAGKKAKKAGSGVLGGEGDRGPLLEEIPQEERKSAAVSEEKAEEKPQAPNDLEGVPDAAALAGMSEAARNALGATLKDRGNKLYSKKEYKRAVECYTKAIEVSIKKDAVFWSNRAACYTNFSPPQYENTVNDCDEALKLDHGYVKALKRRATALENLGRDEEAVRDFTATTIIEKFQDEQAAASVERCLKKLATKKAKEMLDTREPKLPSPTFMSSYLAAFRPRKLPDVNDVALMADKVDDKPALPENPSQGDQTLSLAFDALAAADYNHAVSFVNEAIEQGISSKLGQAEAHNMRGTFKFLIGDSLGAKADLEKALDLVPNFVQAWVKIASVHMELGDAASAFGDFEAAIRHDANDPDIYYHRGQIYFIMQEFDKAIADYNKSTEIDDTFIFTHVQAAVAQYKQGQITQSMAAFRKILRNFPDRGEPSNYYGELLLDQQKFPEAVDRFDKSIELDKNRYPRNVLPIVNKSLAIFQWKQDIGQAEALCKQALDIDPDCDVAVATLAQLSLQQGRIDEAIPWFEKSAQLARTEGELVNAITYEYASKSQKAFLSNYPEYAERLSQMAQAMQ